MSEIWLPGNGFVPVHIRQAEQAVKEYGAHLSLGRDERAGNWVVLMEIDGRLMPVLGLGIELPAPEKIKEKLYRADVRKRGGKIAQDVLKHNDAILRAHKERASEGSGEAAEVYDWAFRKLGTHPNPRIFVPSGGK